MKNSKLPSFFLCLLFFTFSVHSLSFTKKMTDEQKQKLNNGNFVIKSIYNTKNVSVAADEKTSLVINAFKNVKTRYLAEIIYTCPVKGNEDFIQKLSAALIDVEHYVDIPYYSERHQRWFKMYDSAVITKTVKQGSSVKIYETLEMQMFGKFNGEIDIEDNGDYYLYKLKNLEQLKYHGKFKVCSAGEMQSVIAIYKENDRWVVYVLGGIYTPPLPFMGERAETAFINRVIAFSDFVFKQINN